VEESTAMNAWEVGDGALDDGAELGGHDGGDGIEEVSGVLVGEVLLFGVGGESGLDFLEPASLE